MAKPSKMWLDIRHWTRKPTDKNLSALLYFSLHLTV